MSHTLPQRRFAASNGVQISTTAGRIEIVSAAVFSGEDDRIVRALLRRLFLHDAVRVVKIDRSRTAISIRYDDAHLDPHTALTIFSSALRNAAGNNLQGPLDGYLECVPGNVLAVERHQGGRSGTIGRLATQLVLTRLSRIARNGGQGNRAAVPGRSGKLKSIRLGGNFTCEYIEPLQSSDLMARAIDANGSGLKRFWQARELDAVDATHRNWLGNCGMVEVYRLGNLAAAGGCFVLSVVGLVTPGVPTVPFILATSYFLARSSPSLNDRLKRSELFGQMIRDWDQHRALRFSTKAKTVALTLVIMGITVAVADLSPIPLFVLLAMGGVGVYLVLRLPTLRTESPMLPAIA